MNKFTKFVFVIIIIAAFSGLIYVQLETKSIQSTTQPINQNVTPTPTLSSTPTASAYMHANVTANISVTSISNFHDTSIPQGVYLLINGTVTNNSPIACGAGLHVIAYAVPIDRVEAVIGNTVPIQSGTYDTNTNYNLTKLNPYQTVTITIRVLPNYQSEIAYLMYPKVTIV
jgi:hypothetical protein